MDLWIAPNCTKHIWQYVTNNYKHIETFTTLVSSQFDLKEFQSTLNTVIKQNGLVTDKMIQVEIRSLYFQHHGRLGRTLS